MYFKPQSLNCVEVPHSYFVLPHTDLYGPVGEDVVVTEAPYPAAEDVVEAPYPDNPDVAV